MTTTVSRQLQVLKVSEGTLRVRLRESEPTVLTGVGQSFRKTYRWYVVERFLCTTPVCLQGFSFSTHSNKFSFIWKIFHSPGLLCLNGNYTWGKRSAGLRLHDGTLGFGRVDDTVYMCGVGTGKVTLCHYRVENVTPTVTFTSSFRVPWVPVITGTWSVGGRPWEKTHLGELGRGKGQERGERKDTVSWKGDLHSYLEVR